MLSLCLRLSVSLALRFPSLAFVLESEGGSAGKVAICEVFDAAAAEMRGGDPRSGA